MTSRANVEIVGAKEAIKGLRKIDPELRKEFNRDAKEITEPIVTAARNAYRSEYLSGMARKWTQRGNLKFPYDIKAAQRGVRFKADTSRKAVSVLKIQQVNPAAVILDIAGKGSANALGGALDRFGRPSRVMWPAAEDKLPQVTDRMEKAVLAASRRVQKEL
jgi:hypothetical protein